MSELEPIRQIARSALAADALDALGLRRQCLPWDIVPVRRDSLLVGRAYTVRCEPVDRVPDAPYATLLSALDDVGPDDVFTIATGRCESAAVWGELVSTACIAQGAAGALTDGLVRDADRLHALGKRFPVFSRGTVPYDISGRLEIVALATIVQIGHVEIAHGDLLVGDCDGVTVVPASAAEAMLNLLREKIAGESAFRRAVAEGMKPSLAYAEFGVL